MPLTKSGAIPSRLTVALTSREPVSPDAANSRWVSTERSASLRAGRGRRCPHSAARYGSSPTPPIQLAQLREIIRGAYSADLRHWPHQVHGGIDVTVLAAAFSVSGLPQGLYALEVPGSGPLVSLPATAWLPSLRAKYADAPVVLCICADLATVCALRGDSGYGSVIVRVGAFGYAILLAALVHGLEGSAYGRTSLLITRAAQQVNHQLRHLFTVAVGTGDRPAAGLECDGGGTD